MTTAPKLNTEMFVIPDNGSYIGYAPLRRLVMRLQADQVNLLARLKRGRPRKSDLPSPLVTFLREVGVIDGQAEQRPASYEGQPYAPVRVTLFLTNRCNLGCVYCYAGGQGSDMVMPEEIGRAAIDFVAENSKARKSKILSVGFHGGGEPTMAWPQLTALTAYAREVAGKAGLKPEVGMSTNGVFSEDRARWIAENMSYLSVSFDGPPRIQDSQRPMKNGKASSKRVMRVLKILDERKFPYSFQSTVTDETAHEMPSIVRYFAAHTHPQFMKFEPVSDCGRFYGKPERIPSGKLFARYYNEAFEVAHKLGLKLSFSGIRLWGAAVGYFCGAFAEPFSVTPDGFVSACYEAYSNETPYSQTFLFGRWNPRSARFDIDLGKLEHLRRRNVYNLSPCKWCFCKYSCGGDCATRNFRISRNNDLQLVGARCEAIREVTRFRLAQYVDGATGEAAPPKEKVHEENRSRRQGVRREAVL